jgi:sulfite reductase (NADPH) flavoprotein alpha-component
MTISIWRYSHLTLAISSALFIVIAALTGIVLAFEPISNKLEPYASQSLNTVSIAETIGVLQERYDAIISIAIDENDFVSAAIINEEGESKTFYINPQTGEKIGDLIKRSPVFEFATNLHRSLFLKSTGRFLIGFVSFLLFLIVITGMLLIVKRQGGSRMVFSKIVKEDFHQYYHIIFGRFFLIPIAIIALTGIYLSLEKFSLLPKNRNTNEALDINKSNENLKVTDFEFFKTTKLEVIKKLEFPFSSSKEDYFYIETINNNFEVHQFNGQIVGLKKQGFVHIGLYYSLLLHTGKGGIIWAVILLLSCFALLYFIFSGFYMRIKRRKIKNSMRNEITKNAAEFILLVGSETGTTIRFATAFKNALSKANKKVFLTELNNYSSYKNAKNIIIFTATYGAGEAPSNASKFLRLTESVQQKNDLKYTVLGFGSKKYPEFCKFAILVHASLQIHTKFIPQMPVFKIDNKNLNSFKNWKNEWSSLNNIPLEINQNNVLEKDEETIFKVTSRDRVNVDDTFLISLEPNKKIKFNSGDLLAITPEGEQRKRLYSIAKVDNQLLLSVKKNDFGVCSNYLYTLDKKDRILGKIQQNENFNFPKKIKEVILIANGTGIAPFLGMIQKNKKVKIHLFWGGRTKKSLAIYKKYIVAALENKTLTSFKTAYSREEKKYVQDLLKSRTAFISDILKKEGVVLICGSLNMQLAVEKVLDSIASQELNISIEELKENKQIRTDCY